jgi:hypothetical protein
MDAALGFNQRMFYGKREEISGNEEARVSSRPFAFRAF